MSAMVETAVGTVRAPPRSGERGTSGSPIWCWPPPRSSSSRWGRKATLSSGSATSRAISTWSCRLRVRRTSWPPCSPSWPACNWSRASEAGPTSSWPLPCSCSSSPFWPGQRPASRSVCRECSARRRSRRSRSPSVRCPASCANGWPSSTSASRACCWRALSPVPLVGSIARSVGGPARRHAGWRSPGGRPGRAGHQVSGSIRSSPGW